MILYGSGLIHTYLFQFSILLFCGFAVRTVYEEEDHADEMRHTSHSTF